MSCAESLSPYDAVAASTWRDRYQQWAENLDDPNAEPVVFFKPFPPQRLESLELVRSLTRELAERRANEERLAALAAEQAELETTASPVEITEQVADEDEEDLPTVKTVVNQMPSRFVPSKKADADESLFTKYA